MSAQKRREGQAPPLRRGRSVGAWRRALREAPLRRRQATRVGRDAHIAPRIKYTEARVERSGGHPTGEVGRGGPLPSSGLRDTPDDTVRLAVPGKMFAHSLAPFFRPLRKLRLCFFCHRQREAAIPPEGKARGRGGKSKNLFEMSPGGRPQLVIGELYCRRRTERGTQRALLRIKKMKKS